MEEDQRRLGYDRPRSGSGDEEAGKSQSLPDGADTEKGPDSGDEEVGEFESLPDRADSKERPGSGDEEAAKSHTLP